MSVLFWLRFSVRLWLLTVVAMLVLSPSVAMAAVAAPQANSLSPTNYFKVIKNQVFTPGGKIYIPEGISIYGGLEDTDYMENTANLDAQIKAAAIYWHTNTVRLQVAESNLFQDPTKGQQYNQQFLDELIREVNLARQYHQAVVINDQTEFTNNTPLPKSVLQR